MSSVVGMGILFKFRYPDKYVCSGALCDPLPPLSPPTQFSVLSHVAWFVHKLNNVDEDNLETSDSYVSVSSKCWDYSCALLHGVYQDLTHARQSLS